MTPPSPENSSERNSPLTGLPPAELDVLACLWQRGPSTAAEIRQQLRDYRPMAHGSILTLLTRLMDRKLVTRKKSGQGKSYLYASAREPEPALARLVRDFAQRIFGGSRVAMLASLLDAGAPSATELQEMRRLLGEARSRQSE